MLPLSEVQTALYAALAAACSPVPVLDHAGPDQEYPFVTLGEITAEQLDHLANEATGLDVFVHVWSRQPGMKEIQQIMTAAAAAVHRRTFTLATAGNQCVSARWQFSQTLRDADGVTRHGVMRFRVELFAVV